ncbi:MAG: hypothetical protein WDN06_05025 [Asticcacaulis sp.]
MILSCDRDAASKAIFKLMSSSNGSLAQRNPVAGPEAEPDL